MNIIQQALQAYLELAQHMRDEVCQSYQGDVMLAKQAMTALAQEAEPVAWIDLSKMTPSGMVYATGFKANDRQTALYASPPKPAPLPLPVASVPQGLNITGEEGGMGFNRPMLFAASDKATAPSEIEMHRADYSAIKAGHLRVPAEWKIGRVDADTLKIMWGGSGLVVNKSGTMSQAVAAIALYEIAEAILAASQQEGV